jgi:hypothetical protein
MDERTPSIIVCLSKSFKEERVLQEALRGVEEESIPYQILQEAMNNGVSLAYSGAERSMLEVGIGIDSIGCLAVHYRKLPPERPLYNLDYVREFNSIRSVCANAARLVKNTPFIEIKEGSQ